MCHIEYVLRDNPEAACCSTLGPDSGKSSCEGMWMSWQYENTQTDGVSNYSSEREGHGTPSLLLNSNAKTKSVQHREAQVPAGCQGCPFLAHPPALARALLVQSRKRVPRNSPPGILSLIADGNSTVGSAPLPGSVTFINFCKDVLQRQSWWFKISLGQRNKSLWHISRLMGRSSPLVQKQQWLIRAFPVERNVTFCVCYTRQ